MRPRPQVVASKDNGTHVFQFFKPSVEPPRYHLGPMPTFVTDHEDVQDGRTNTVVVPGSRDG